MNLKQRLMEDMKTSLKAGEKVKLDTIRFFIAQLKNWEIDHGEMTDEAVVDLLLREIKQMEDAMAEFTKGGRLDLVEAEAPKVAILKTYLPAQLTPEELKEVIAEVRSAQPDLQMGPLIGQVMLRVKGKAAGNLVSQLVREALASQ